MRVRLRRELYGKKGVILINAALISEFGMMNLCNNNIILIKSDKDEQRKRLLKRGLSEDEIEKRFNSQLSFEQKKKRIEEKIKKDGYGRLWVMDKNFDKVLKDNPKVDSVEKLINLIFSQESKSGKAVKA